MEVIHNADGTFEVAAHDLYEYEEHYFGPRIKVKQSFIVNKKRYTSADGQTQSVPVSHSGLDLKQYANGRFLCKNEVPMHITIIRPLEF